MKLATGEMGPDKFCCQELIRAIRYKRPGIQPHIQVIAGQVSLLIGDNSKEQKEHEEVIKERKGMKPSNLARSYTYQRILYCPFCGKRLPDDIT